MASVWSTEKRFFAAQFGLLGNNDIETVHISLGFAGNSEDPLIRD
ncbi:MAG: hypothetical protein P8L39_07305 [Halioglobus sp.]|nr:hypothetical protein [Halioglobus sp.]